MTKQQELWNEERAQRHAMWAKMSSRVIYAPFARKIVGKRSPGAGRLPTDRWPPGAVIADVYSLPLDPGLPPGRYTLQLGMQRFMTDWWLPIGKSGQRGDFLNLGEILYSY